MLISGCRPEGVLSHGEMADLLTDLYLTDGYIDADGDGLRAWDSLDVYGPRLAEHGVTLPEFENSVEYYLHHPRDFSKIYDDVQENLEKAFNEVTRQIEKEEEEAEEAEAGETEVEPAEEETVTEKPDRPVREGVEPRIERADKADKVDKIDKVETTDKKEEKKQAPKRRNIRKKLSKKELEELEKQLKQ